MRKKFCLKFKDDRTRIRLMPHDLAIYCVVWLVLAACSGGEMPMEPQAAKYFLDNQDRLSRLASEFEGTELLVVRRAAGGREISVRYGEPLRQETLSGPTAEFYRTELDELLLDRVERVEKGGDIRFWPKNSIARYSPDVRFYLLLEVSDESSTESCDDNVDFSTSGYCRIALSSSWFVYYYW